jgi:hypothetical protein
MDEAPLPCQSGDVVEVPSQTQPDYTYLVRIPRLSDRMRLEARLARLRSRLNQVPKLVAILRSHTEELNGILGKPVLFEEVLMRLEKGESIDRVPVEGLEGGALEDAIRMNTLADVDEKYTEEVRRLDPYFLEITEDMTIASSEFFAANVSYMLWGVKVGDKRYEDISRKRAEEIVESMSDWDLNTVFVQARELYELRNEVKKN